MRRLVAVLVTSVLLPVSAFAHPGHGVPGEGWTAAHYAAEPAHLLTGLGAVAVALAAAWLARRGFRRDSAAARPPGARRR